MNAALLLLALIAPAAEGRRVDTGESVVFLPDGYRPEAGRVDVVLHLHGAGPVVERALAEAGWRAVLVEFNRPGLSGAYARPFADPALFPRLLDGALKAVAEAGLAPDPRLGRVVVSSFSAGFGGVRELLNVPAHVDRIDALVMADSLYAGYLGDPADRRIDPAKLAGFERFAVEAASGRKAFLLTHSAQVPDGYASTTETADALLRAVAGRSESRERPWAADWLETRRFARGRLLLIGFAGAGPDDHMRHLRRLGDLWKALPGGLGGDQG